MPFSRTCRQIAFVFILLLSVVQISCNKLSKEDSTESLKKRATEYWDFKVRGEFEKAFPYELPSSVEGLTLTQYISSIGLGAQWLGAESDSVSIDGDQGWVGMKIRYKWAFTQDQPAGGMVGQLNDQWKLQQGKWYHVYTGRRGKKDETAASKAGENAQKQVGPVVPKAGPHDQKSSGITEPAAPELGHDSGKHNATGTPDSQQETAGQREEIPPENKSIQKPTEQSNRP